MEMTELERYVLKFGGMCRDCADENGTCPHSGIPCDSDIRLKMVRSTIKALIYGIAQGYIANPFIPEAGRTALERSEG